IRLCRGRLYASAITLTEEMVGDEPARFPQSRRCRRTHYCHCASSQSDLIDHRQTDQGLPPRADSLLQTRAGKKEEMTPRDPADRATAYFPFPSRTKVNSFGGAVGPFGAFPGTAPGAAGGALGNGGSTCPWPPRK